MKIANIKYFCTVNGDGIGISLFATGCSRRCPGCIAKKYWDYNSGHEFTEELFQKVLDKLEPSHISHLSLLGGEPLDPANVETMAKIVKAVRERYGNTKKIWMWTGYLMKDVTGYEYEQDMDGIEDYEEVLKTSGCKFEYIPENEHSKYILDNIDILIDGPFIQKLHKFGLHFKGSKNQRLIYLKSKK